LGKTRSATTCYVTWKATVDVCNRTDQGFPTFLWPCTPSAFRQMSMYPFSIAKDNHVPFRNFLRWTCTPKVSYDKIFCRD